MSSSNVYTTMTSSISKEIANTPATSATFIDKPTWESKPTFEPSNVDALQENFNDVGDNWSGGDWENKEALDVPSRASSRNPFDTFHNPHSSDNPSCPPGFVLESSWGTGPPVEIPAYHTHFTVIDSMDQQNGDTHYLLESNRGFLFHGHEKTGEWKKLKLIGGDGSEFASVPMNLVPAEFLFPKHHAWMTLFQGNSEDEEVYMKKQAFLARDKFRNDHHAGCTRQEVSRCELISKTPHPNLARYLGVETRKIGDEERVVRIAYRRYSMDLHNFVLMKRYLQPHHIPFLMQGIEKGMRHLHRLGLVHCDLRPMNIFVSINDAKDVNDHVVLKEVVIGDFDASVKIGEEVSLKRASKDWWPAETEWGVRAGEWIDEWCLEKMGRWLREDGLGIWEFGGKATSSPSPATDDGFVSEIIAALPNNGW